MVSAAVQFDQVLEVIWVSLVMGVGAIALFALVIHGWSRAGDGRRSGHGAGTLYGALAVVSLVAFAGVVVFGITVILQKD